MFKLLTDKERQKVKHEYVLRRTIVMLFALVSVLVIGIIGLLPAYILSNVRQNEALEWARIIDNSGLKENETEFQAWLLETNRRLAVLSPRLDVDRPSDFIDKILVEKTLGVSILTFSLTKMNDKITLSISGVALDRQILVTFRDRLDSSGYFSDVTLPISDLAKDKDINFQIKFSAL